MSALAELSQALASGAVRVVDLTHTLDPDFPVIVLPPEFGQCAPFRMEEISAYDHRGPAWKWNNFSMGEHTGTHFDAPKHWISGRDLPNGAVDEIDPGVFVGHVSGMVRDRLWDKCCERLRDGGVVQMWSTNNEQRFAIRAAGDTKREVVDFEGLTLIRRPANND